MEKDIKTRLRETMNQRGIKFPQLSVLTGIPAARMYKWYQDNSTPKHDDVVVLEKWINGELEETPKNENDNIVSEHGEDYITQRRIKKSAPSLPYLVPFMPVRAQAGYVRAVDQSRYIEAMDLYALPPGINPQGAIWRYWEVEGDSMEPTFHNGDVILTSQVHQMDWENIRNFYTYVVVLEDHVYIKRLYAKSPNDWVLISENEDLYPQQLISIEKVKEVWVYRRSIVSKAQPPKQFKIKV